MAPLKCSALVPMIATAIANTPGAEAAPVAHQDEVRYRAHGAKISALNGGAKRESYDEATNADNGGCRKFTHLSMFLPISDYLRSLVSA